MVASDLPLKLILHDLTEHLRQDFTGIISAARALDGICQQFAPTGKARDAGWAPMREALNASEDFVKSVTKQSRGPRHADWGSTSGDDNRKMIERAWILMNRFLEYKKRGNQKLPQSEFPLLED
jgi:hypothetical protein